MIHLKHLFIGLCLVFACQTAFGQKELVTLDEHNKYIYYKVADMPGVQQDTLFSRCVKGIKTSKRFAGTKAVITAGSAVLIKSKTTIYSSVTVVKHEIGDLAYTLTVEFKDGKYRYWLTDFVVTPYERNRYGVYALVPGGGTPFEQMKGKIDTKQFDDYLSQIGTFGNELGDEVKLYVTNPVKKVLEPVKVDTKKW